MSLAGARCTDPGTPGGMEMVDASFEVDGQVTYNCTRRGYVAMPDNRTCVYNASSQQVDWNQQAPVCIGQYHKCMQDRTLLLYQWSVINDGVRL